MADSNYTDLLQFAPGAKSPARQDTQPAQQQGAAPTDAPTPTAGPAYQQLMGLAPKSLPSMAPAQPGLAPENPIPESPLSLAERAMMGWVRTPQEQEKLLKSHFDDVRSISTGSGTGFAVKKNGKWFDADPAFHWDRNSLNDLPGDIAQFTGEYGLRTAGAAMGTAAALLAVPTGGLSIPAAAAGMAALGLGGAALGSMGAEAVDLGSRAALNDPSSIGARPYDAKQINQQMALSALYGMETETGNKVGGAVLSKAADVLGGVIKRVSNTPEGRTVVRKFMSMLGGDEVTTEARLLNPQRNAVYDKIAAADATSPLDYGNHKLPKVEDGVFTELQTQMEGIKNKEAAEFARLKTLPEVQKAQIDTSKSMSEAVQLLRQEGYITESGAINQSRQFGGSDRQAIQRIIRASKNATQMSYDGARQFTQDLNTLLNSGAIGSDTIYAAVAKLKTGVNQSIIDGVGTEAGQAYGKVLNKYSTAKALMTELDRATDKKQTFINKLMSPDKRSQVGDLVKGLVNVGVDEDSLTKLIQIQGAKQAQNWFNKDISITKPWRALPTGGKAQAAVITAASDAKQAVVDPIASKITPYFDKVMRGLRTMDPRQRSTMLQNPQAVDAIHQMVIGGAAGEQGAADQLLQQTGVKQ